jgi:hypothetical protein
MVYGGNPGGDRVWWVFVEFRRRLSRCNSVRCIMNISVSLCMFIIVLKRWRGGRCEEEGGEEDVRGAKWTYHGARAGIVWNMVANVFCSRRRLCYRHISLRLCSLRLLPGLSVGLMVVVRQSLLAGVYSCGAQQ